MIQKTYKRLFEKSNTALSLNIGFILLAKYLILQFFQQATVQMSRQHGPRHPQCLYTKS